MDGDGDATSLGTIGNDNGDVKGFAIGSTSGRISVG